MHTKKPSLEVDFVNYPTDGLPKPPHGEPQGSSADVTSAELVKKSTASETVKVTSSFTQTTLSPSSIQTPDLKDGTFISNDFYAAQAIGRSFAKAVTASKPPSKDNEQKLREIITKPKHYIQGNIETWDYIVSQGLGYLEGNVIKYVTRYKHKNGREDLLKAQAYLNKLLEQVQK